MEQQADQLVTLIDENGREVLFDLVATFDYDGKRYAALFPMDDVAGVADDEVVLLEIVRENGEETYRTIESEILLEEVFDEFMDIFEQMADGEDDADDGGEEGPDGADA